MKLLKHSKLQSVQDTITREKKFILLPFSFLNIMFSSLNFAPESRVLLTANDTEVQQVMPTASEIYFKPEETGTIKFFSLQTILMIEKKPVCFRKDDIFLTQESTRLQDFILYKLWKTGKRISVPDVLAICVNSQSCTNNWIIWETLFSGLRVACWIKAVRTWKKNAMSYHWSRFSVSFSYVLLPLMKDQTTFWT